MTAHITSNLLLFRIGLAVALLVSSQPAAARDANEYRERDGSRMEGIDEVDTAASDLQLEWFGSHRETRTLSTDEKLVIEFYVPIEEPVFITASEIVPVHHYFMRPLQERWPVGWQRFADWPVTPVLSGLSIGIEDLGIVTRLRDKGQGNGLVAPVLLYVSSRPTTVSRYELTFTSNETLREIDLEVSRYETDEPLIERDIDKEFKAGVPISLVIDLGEQSAGWFTMELHGRVKNQPGGPERTYHFYHQPKLPSS